MKPSAAFLRFHSRVGIRLAFRLLAPVLAGLFAFYYLLKPEFLLLLAGQVFGRSAPAAQGFIVAVAVLLAARTAAPRVSFGLGGWLRHLPVSAKLERRTASLAVFIGQSPLVLTMALLILAGGMNASGSPLFDLTGLVLAAYAAAMALLPSSPRAARLVLGFAAAAFAGSGQPVLMAIAALLLLVLDRISGGIESAHRRLKRRKPAPPALFWAVIDLRALGPTVFLGPAAAAVPAVLLRFFLRNNDLPASAVPAAVRFGIAMSFVAGLAVTAGLLAARRPPWPWSRSLGRTSRRAIAADALFLAAIGILALPAFLPLHPEAALSGLAFLIPAAVLAAGAVRTAGEARFGVAWSIVLQGAVAAMAFALATWTPVAFLAFSPAVFLDAVRRERRLKVTRWTEIRHSAGGDSLSWSGR